jgi:GT2 family glycosyltransferase/trans-aconitate methyltransferase
MNIILNYRHKNERLEESLRNIGHDVIYNVWDIGEIKDLTPGAVMFEFKQILKEEIRFARLSLDLKKAGIPRATWCLDIPNIGAKHWKLSFILRSGLIDIFATHSMQGLVDLRMVRSRLMYLPNAAWTSRYGPGNVSLEELRDPGRYCVDVSFIGNLDSARHKEHKHRTDFLDALAVQLAGNGLSYRFEDGRHMDYATQIDLIQRSRININYGCAADRNSNRSWGMPERCYGVPASGGFLLSDERVHAKDDFVVGEELVMFGGIDDCLQKIIYYKGAFEESRLIAEKAHLRVMAEHTYDHRATQLMAAVRGLRNAPDIRHLPLETRIDTQKPAKVSIIILNWNKLEYTRKCIESIEQNTAYPNYEIIVFDNGSREPGTMEYLSALRHKTVMSARNIGFAAGNNKAVSFATGDLLLFLNNDTVAYKGWLEEMVKTFAEYPKCGIVGSKLLYPDGTIQHMGVVIGNKGNRYHSYKGYPADIPPAMKLNECEAVTGACMLMHRDLFMLAGGFDEAFLHGSEDIDLCFKVRNLGMKVVYCPKSVLIHYEQVSFREKGKWFRKRTTRKNDRLFMKRWGATIEDFRLPYDLAGLKPQHYYTEANPNILRLVPADAHFILDVGCSSGMLGKALKDRSSRIKVWGIEISKDFALEAQKYLDRVIVKNIGDGPIFDAKEQFDCIICADVLAHLKDPWDVLAKLSRHLAPGGRLIASVPNLQYYRVVRDVISDRWQYRSEGILDREHLRFFTLATIKNLFAVTGYKIISVETSKKASKLLKIINWLLFRKFEKFLTQQYFIVCKRRLDD